LCEARDYKEVYQAALDAAQGILKFVVF